MSVIAAWYIGGGIGMLLGVAVVPARTPFAPAAVLGVAFTAIGGLVGVGLAA